MRSRQQIEDIIQRGLCAMLPKMPPQDIRPAYQQQDFAGKAIKTDGSEYEYAGFTPNDNFIYIWAKIAESPIGPYQTVSGDIQITNTVNATITIYGSQSYQLALTLKSLFVADENVAYFENNDLFYQGVGDIQELHEIINEQWFERHEFTVTFYENVNVRNPFKTVIAESTDIKAIINENDTIILEDTLK